MLRLWISAVVFLAAAMFVLTATFDTPEVKSDEILRLDAVKQESVPRLKVGRVLPRHVMDQLELSNEQIMQLDELEAKMQTDLEKILTPDQVKQAEAIDSPRLRGLDSSIKKRLPVRGKKFNPRQTEL